MKAMRKSLGLALIVVLLLTAFGAVAYAQDATPTPAPAAAAATEPVVPEIPFLKDWQGSGHADATAEAFRHWDADRSGRGSCCLRQMPRDHRLS